LHPKSAPMSPVECCETTTMFCFNHTDETPIKKLQTFLGQNQEDEAELEISFVIESLEITLFMDIDEVCHNIKFIITLFHANFFT
jgi:hypothetical protein